MNNPTLNNLLRVYGPLFREKYPSLSYAEKKVIHSLSICRTEQLGGRIEACDSCGYQITLYNSCRNRHCPQCQSMKKEQWILERKREILPFIYFHIVFTLPHELNTIVLRNKRLLYNILFTIAKKTLLSISAQEKYFGADIGFFAILHTWGQKLGPHPHLHCVVPGGGYSRSKGKWIHAPYNFLVPVQVLKRRFRSIFLQELKTLYSSGSLYITGTKYEDPAVFQHMIDTLFSTEWVVYLKESFQRKESVIEYLARYTHRIAFSNHRLVSVENDTVSFKYRDYMDNNRIKTECMNVHTFLRRFLLHVVPYRFVRIRYFGLLAHRNKRKALESCREYYELEVKKDERTYIWHELLLRVTGIDCHICPACRSGTLSIKELIMPERYRAPPDEEFSLKTGHISQGL